MHSKRVLVNATRRPETLLSVKDVTVMVEKEFARDNLEIGRLRRFTGRSYPFFHSFASDGALFLVCEDKAITHQVAQRLTTKLVSIYSSNLYLHVFDPLFFGGHLDELAKLHVDVRSHRVHTEQDGLAQILKELRLRISAVNQDVLSGEAETQTLSNYLEQNLDSDEKIHLFFVNGFPYRWDERSISLFSDILRLGPSAGVYPIVMVDPSVELDVDLKERSVTRLLNLGRVLFSHSGVLELVPSPIARLTGERFVCSIEGDRTFNKSTLEDINSRIEAGKKRSVRIEGMVEPLLGSGSTLDDIEVPVGKKGNGDIQYFVLGESANCFHALIGGGTGSGKTVLLHNIILYGSAVYSEDELQFCLLDYKEGTEFQRYMDIPNVRVLSMESELDFGLSFLEYVGRMIEERGAYFKRHGVSSVRDARRETGEHIPRIVVVIDEFQVLLSDGYRRSGRVAELLDDISKRGRSFGIHLVLSSQSLSGVGLRTSTISQMPLRLVLRISDTDSERFLSSGNVEPAFFKRRGQAISNAQAGLLEANEYFSVSLVDDSSFSALGPKIRAQTGKPHILGAPKRVFDPSEELLLKDIPAELSVRTHGFVAGKPFYMSADYYHVIDFEGLSQKSSCFCSRSIPELLSFASVIAGQLSRKFDVGVFCEQVQFEKIKRVVSENFGIHDLVYLQDEDQLLSFLSEPCERCLVVPDICNYRPFRSSGISKTKSAEGIVRAMAESANVGFGAHLGIQNRKKAMDVIDFGLTMPELAHKVVLSNGTEMERQFDDHAQKISSSGMALHYSDELMNGRATFQKIVSET